MPATDPQQPRSDAAPHDWPQAPVIVSAKSAADMAEVAELFRAYAASLPVDLAYQGFADEVAALPGAYAPPRGALLVARAPTGAALGCVAVRPSAEPGICEIKRLYLLPAARGLGIGRRLAVAAIDVARATGYEEVRLDTLASMERAYAMYLDLGFGAIAPYYAPTPPGTRFMALKLPRASAAEPHQRDTAE